MNTSSVSYQTGVAAYFNQESMNFTGIANVDEYRAGYAAARERMETIKSVCPVQNSGGWVARVRTQSGREQFIGIGAGYTMHQAQVLCDSVRRDAANHGAEFVLSAAFPVAA